MDPELDPGTDPAAGTPPPPSPAAGTVVKPPAGGRPATWQDLIDHEAKKQGVDPRLARAVAETESSYNPDARSPKGAVGIMQLMPETAARWKVDPHDPIQNIQGGISELKALIDQHQGDVTLALRRYNGSPQTPDAVTQPYVDRVLKRIKPATSPGVAPPAAAQTAPALTPKVGTPPPTPAPEGWGSWALRQGQSMLESVDPRTPSGRRNIAGGLGAAAGTAAVTMTAPVSLPVLGLGAATAGVLGAIGGGMTAEAGEQLIGTSPPSSSSVLTAGGEQGLYEAGGHALLWPVKAVARRAIGTRVGRYAAEKIAGAKASTLDALSSALESSKTLLRQTKAGATEATARASTGTRGLISEAAGGARKGVQEASALGEGQVAGAKGLAAQGVSQAEARGVAGEAAARAPYEKLVGAPPPRTAEVGRQVQDVIAGPAGKARDLAGQAVEAAAKSGPDVDIMALKAEAQRILESQITPPAESFPRQTAAGLSDATISGQSGFDPARVAELRDRAAGKPSATGTPTTPEAQARARANLKDMEAAVGTQTAVTDAQAEAGKETLKHPALQLVSRILNAGDTVPFHDAHLLKVELDNAIRGSRDQAVRSQVASLTQHLTGGLREALRQAGHAPYEQATAAYAKIAPLYTKGHAARLRKLAVDEPEAIIRLLNPSQPTKARMLVDLLTTQAAAGGDEAGGRQALEAVQSAWVRQKVLNGGIEKLGDRLAKIPPEFRSAFLGDRKAQTVLANLQLIDTAYKTAVQQGERGVEAATLAGKGGVSAAGDLAAQRTGAVRETGRQAVQGARDVRTGVVAQTRQAGAARVEQAAAAVPPAKAALRAGGQAAHVQEQALAASSLGPTQRKGAGEHTAADVLRAMVLGPRSIWGALSTARLLHGPTATDLVHWAAASPTGTRALVKAITSPAPDVALADLVRTSGVLGGTTDTVTGKEPPAPSPSPQEEARAGGPPPR